MEKGKREKDRDSPLTVVGVRISHPDRVIYPDLGTSKIQLARYYERIAKWIVPHVAGRPQQADDQRSVRNVTE